MAKLLISVRSAAEARVACACGADLMAVLYTVDGLQDLLAPGLKAPGKDRYIRRGGHVFDMHTGQMIH